MPFPPLILASRSPRRAEILNALGIAFKMIPAEVDEIPLTGERPADCAARIALTKARAVSETREREFVLGADTVVYVGNVLYGTPATPEEARAMLKALSGRTHRVTTALALVRRASGLERRASETTEVSFRALDDSAIERCVAAKEPYDKAGGYAIQGRSGLALVSSLRGSYTNVVGLPTDALFRLLGNDALI